jgi:hypothetical protein
MSSTEKIITFLLLKFHLIFFIIWFYYKIYQMDKQGRKVLKDRETAAKQAKQANKQN